MKKFEIFESKDYESFKFLEDNRTVEARPKLQESIKQLGLICPIITTKDGYIIDGQHRFVALRALQMPIHYCINRHITGEAVLDANNNQKAWVITDYIHRLSKRGNQACITLEGLLSDYAEFSPSTVAQVVSTKFAGVYASIKSGSYDITEESQAFGESVLENCLELEDYVGFFKSIKLVRAMYAIMKKNPHFDIDHLKRKTEYNKIHIYQKETDTAISIMEVYNWKTKTSDKIEL